ncbi:hypothetical protein [Rhodopila sp.]|uniref:hypothetical protein n=1 Tax=Rhodopila sp. TaxID=2480087 RepID=UPI003D0D243C
MNFSSASQLHWTSKSFADTVKTQALRPLILAYVANVHRSLFSHELLDCVMHSTGLHERARYRVRMQTLARPFINSDDLQVVKDSLRAMAKAEWLTFRTLAFPGERDIPGDPLEPGDREDILGSVIAYADGGAALQATLENQVTNTWTAVESLYRRLCREACHVRDLHSVPSIKPIDPDALRFASLPSARKSYRQVFGPDPIPAAMSDQALDILSSLRHALEHNAGYCDLEYLNRVDSYPALPKAKMGDKILLDGPATLAFVQAVIPVAEGLIHQVDDWIQSRL